MSSHPFGLRPARQDDQGRIKSIVRAAGINPLELAWQRFIVAEADGKLIGVGQVKAHLDRSRELASIAVVPEWRGQGVGSTIVMALLVQEQRTLYLTCRAERETFYSRFGFRRAVETRLPPYFATIRAVVGAIGYMARLLGKSAPERRIMIRQP